uniref:Large ribosomal subunit protein uL24c n=1 Tax=Chondria sp. (in: red algae) TaxID=1982705 RepID=A0A1Z1MEJ2_9FLOR|nr:ribosomal protein L24 [Chondria sp. (in: red algae)]
MKTNKIKIKRGENIKVISGKYKGKTGKIKNILVNKNMITVEDINIRTKHMKPKQSEEKGSRIKVEFPIHYSNIKQLKQ